MINGHTDAMMIS